MSIAYRREIDGLRAVAVLPVIFFHAHIPPFAGGYVGVDIFFVISGYLITSILLDDIANGRFSLLKFYERRIRRIFPALFLVIFATIPFAMLWMTPDRMKDYAQSIVAVCVFLSNVLFWRESGYFDVGSETKPLLHTWSLSVEEQFYVVFPLILFLVWRLKVPVVAVVFAVIFASSFLLADWMSTRFPATNFFLAPSRVWELTIGAGCGLWLHVNGQKANGLLAMAGLAMIVLAIFAFDAATPFPSRYALVPVIGTALVILFAGEGTLSARLLGVKPMVGVGLISYSAYLWHQPILAFLRIRTDVANLPATKAAVVVGSLLLAYVTWRFVETPFRRSRVTRRSVFAGAAIVMAVMAGFGAMGQMSHGFRALRMNDLQEKLLATAQHSVHRNECLSGLDRDIAPEDACRYFHDDAPIVVLGDSHAIEIGFALAEALDDDGLGVRVMASAQCPPAWKDAGNGTCVVWSREAVETIVADRSVSTVVLSYRMTLYLSGHHRTTYPTISRDVDDTERAKRWQSLVSMAEAFEAAGKHVIFVKQAPELRRNIKDLIQIEGRDSGTIAGSPRAWWDARYGPVLSRIEDLSDKADIVDTEGVFCDEVTCFAARDGVAYYFDSHHVSMPAAWLIVESIVEKLRQEACGHGADINQSLCGA